MRKEVKRLLMIAAVICVVAIGYWGVNSILSMFTAHDLWVFGAGFATCWVIDFILTLASGKSKGNFTTPAGGAHTK